MIEDTLPAFDAHGVPASAAQLLLGKNVSLNEYPEKKANYRLCRCRDRESSLYMTLSGRRVELVEEILTGKGIDKERIILIERGDTGQ